MNVYFQFKMYAFVIFHFIWSRKTVNFPYCIFNETLEFSIFKKTTKRKRRHYCLNLKCSMIFLLKQDIISQNIKNYSLLQKKILLFYRFFDIVRYCIEFNVFNNMQLFPIFSFCVLVGLIKLKADHLIIYRTLDGN